MSVDEDMQSYEAHLDQELKISNGLGWIYPLIVIIVIFLVLFCIIRSCAAWKNYKANVAKQQLKMSDNDEESIPLNVWPARQKRVNSDVEAGNLGNVNRDDGMNFLSPAAKTEILSDLRNATAEDEVAVTRIIAEVGFSDIDNGMTALHYACAYMNNHVVDIVLKAGADPNLKDNKGFWPLHYVAMYTEKENFGEHIQENEVEARREHTRDIITLLCKYKAYEQTISTLSIKKIL